ncbi:MAG: hypothetical protein RJB57_1229, partial [Actinomycetota bacterium]
QLNKHADKTVDQAIYDGQLAATKLGARTKFAEATARLQTEGIMGSVAHFYFTMFVNRKNGLTNIGKTKLPEGKTQRIMTNWGIDWSGVQKIAGKG